MKVVDKTESRSQVFIFIFVEKPSPLQDLGIRRGQSLFRRWAMAVSKPWNGGIRIRQGRRRPKISLLMIFVKKKGKEKSLIIDVNSIVNFVAKKSETGAVRLLSNAIPDSTLDNYVL